jgi:hypothetical protein
VSDIDTAVVDSLKALDPKRPIREADNRLHRSETTRCAITGREQMQRRHHSYSISSPSLA